MVCRSQMISLKAVMSMNYESKKDFKNDIWQREQKWQIINAFFLKSDVWRMLLNVYRSDEKEKNALVLPI